MVVKYIARFLKYYVINKVNNFSKCGSFAYGSYSQVEATPRSVQRK